VRSRLSLSAVDCIYRRCCMMAGALRPSGSGCGRSHKATQVCLTVIWRARQTCVGGGAGAQMPT
jgi:hypothetical protein